MKKSAAEPASASVIRAIERQINAGRALSAPRFEGAATHLHVGARVRVVWDTFGRSVGIGGVVAKPVFGARDGSAWVLLDERHEHCPYRADAPDNLGRMMRAVPSGCEPLSIETEHPQ